jgi:CBS domain-containing protein
MSTNIITCYEDETLEIAADHISENDIRRLVVLDRKEKLVGVVSLVDMIKHVEDDSINIEVIRHLFKYA